MYQHLAQLGDDAGSEILGAGRRAGVDDHQIVRLGGFHDAVAERGVVIGQGREAGGQAAPLAHHCGQHQRVILHDVAGAQLAAGRHQLAPGWLDRHAWLAAHDQRGVARSGRRADVLRPQLVVGWQDQLRGDHILSHRPHVLPGRHRGENFDCLRSNDFSRCGSRTTKVVTTKIPALHILHHDDRVRAGWEGIAGVYVERLLADDQVDRSRLRGAAGVFGAHRVAIHRGSMIVRR